MRRYPKYKDSGVEWIGEIPEGWILSKFKFDTTTPVQYGLNISSDKYKDKGIRFIRITDLTEEGLLIKENGKYLEKNEVPDEFLLKKYDLLFCRSGHTVGKSYLHLEDGEYTSGGYLVRFNFSSFSSSKFVFYLTKTNFYWDWIKLNTVVSTIENVNGDKYQNFIYPKPTLQEQQQIVTYLDHKTSLIDQIISVSEKKIELLKEQRTSTINHVVTKGLNPNVKMKDSGVEWIGEIPEGWECRLGTTIGCFFKGKGIKKDEVVDSGNPCIRYGEIYTKYNHKVDSVHSFINDDVSNTSLKIKGTHILLTGSGELSSEIGKAIVITLEEVFIGGDIIILKSGNDFDSFYLTYLINSECVRIQREISSKGEIIVHIYPKNFREMRFCCPPLQEQQEIVIYLDQKTKEIDDLISSEQKRIQLMKEYRQSLISEVVTGKIMVSNS